MASEELRWYDIGGQVNFLIEEVKLLFQWIFEQLLGAAATIVEAIPVPAFADNLGTYVGAISSDVWFFASVFEVQFGASVWASAYTARFLLRRLPFFGA